MSTILVCTSKPAADEKNARSQVGAAIGECDRSCNPGQPWYPAIRCCIKHGYGGGIWCAPNAQEENDSVVSRSSGAGKAETSLAEAGLVKHLAHPLAAALFLLRGRSNLKFACRACSLP
ncbi:hypothetical protein L249_3812 [Ophiocordyceps polyrhachis-furcata BCC 54312]|uniref:Uncharacterized protein n=1 Tax=Ophiocordyceps polyrhachis-furcata BCC 54312 TaxID=1330021 RepID=A0A367L5Y6_9HYPO|nr:hypothetical protein L249_3812 [Ophiocordyceps polyrhachis-furcata BCC 54312]